MSNRYYDRAVARAQTTRAMNLLAGAIKVQLVDLGAYTPNFTTDEYLDSIPQAARLGPPAALTGKTLNGNVFDADDIAGHGFGTALAATGEALVIYEDSGNPLTSPLLIYLDSATGLPTPAGATQMSITWSNGPDRICSL